MNQEIEAMTKIIDSQANKVKSEESQARIKQELRTRYQTYSDFLEIDRELLHKIVRKCEGNPLVCVSIAYQFLTVSPGSVIFLEQLHLHLLAIAGATEEAQILL